MKRLLFALLFLTGVTRLVAWRNRAQVTILCYHSVTRHGTQPSRDPFKMHIQLELFLKHLDHLRANYHVISLSDFVRAHREGTPLRPHSVVLTFDDGFRNFSTVVAKELLHRELTATVFVVTDKIDASDSLQTNRQKQTTDDESLLSWAEVKQLALQGIEFGSHSCSHSRLLGLSPAEVRRELEDSRAALIRHLGPSSFPLAYPHGQTSETISSLAESIGYSCALTTTLGRNCALSDLFSLRRTVVASDDDIPTFAARVSGLTWWKDRLLSFLGAKRNGSIEPSHPYEPLVLNNLDV